MQPQLHISPFSHSPLYLSSLSLPRPSSSSSPVRPSITVEPVDTLQLLSPSPLSLNCTAEGLPAPTITWVRTLGNGSEREYSDPGTPLGGGRLLTITTTNTSSMPDAMIVQSVFRIEPTAIQDTANYTCRASNSVGNATSSSSVFIYGWYYSAKFPRGLRICTLTCYILLQLPPLSPCQRMPSSLPPTK